MGKSEGSEFRSGKLEILTNLASVRVASISSRGDPLIIPVRHVLDGESIYFSVTRNSPFDISLRANRRVAVLGDAAGERFTDFVSLQGLANALRVGREHDKVLQMLKEKYGDRPNAEGGVTLFKVTSLRQLGASGEELNTG